MVPSARSKALVSARFTLGILAWENCKRSSWALSLIYLADQKYHSNGRLVPLNSQAEEAVSSQILGASSSLTQVLYKLLKLQVALQYWWRTAD